MGRFQARGWNSGRGWRGGRSSRGGCGHARSLSLSSNLSRSNNNASNWNTEGNYFQLFLAAWGHAYSARTHMRQRHAGMAFFAARSSFSHTSVLLTRAAETLNPYRGIIVYLDLTFFWTGYFVTIRRLITRDSLAISTFSKWHFCSASKALTDSSSCEPGRSSHFLRINNGSRIRFAFESATIATQKDRRPWSYLHLPHSSYFPLWLQRLRRLSPE